MDTEAGRRQARDNAASELARRRWNVVDLARAADIDVGTAGDFLNGTRWPQRATQNKIEDALGWALGSIYRWENDLTSEADDREPETVGANDQDAGVLASLPPEALEGLDAAERAEVIAAAKLSALQTAREIRRRLDK